MGSPKLVHKRVIGIKTEAVQNTPVALAATDYLLVEDLMPTGISDLLERNPKRSSLSRLSHVMGIKHVEVKFKTETKNGGTPGTIYAPLDAALQACGFVRTIHSGVEAIGAAVANGNNSGVSPAPVIAIGTPAFSALSGVLTLTLIEKTETSPEGAVFQGSFQANDDSDAIVDTATISDSAFANVAFAGGLGAFELTVNDPDAGGLGDPVSTWHIGDSWTFVYTSADQVDVSYLPTSAPASGNYYGPGKSVTIECWVDGLKHVIAGALGTVKIITPAGKLPYWEFSFKGHYADPSDAAAPAQTYVSTIPAAVASSGFTMQGFAAIIANFEFMMNNEVSLRPDSRSVNSLLGFIITNRNPQGSADPEADTVANHAMWNRVMNGTEGAVGLTIGQVAGNITQLAFPAVQYNDAPYDDRNGILIFKTPLQFNAGSDAGDDEVNIILK